MEKLNVIEQVNWVFNEYEIELTQEVKQCVKCWKDIYFWKNKKWNWCPLTFSEKESKYFKSPCFYSHYLFCEYKMKNKPIDILNTI